MAKLKVYRTPAGFHDAFVAAPSQKAALAAWGSDANLFARGLAEVVTDPDLTRAPLAAPGQVIRLMRTAGDESDGAPHKKRARKPTSSTQGRARNPRPPPEPKPKPSRDALNQAEAALKAAETRHTAQRMELKREEEALAKRRRALDAAHTAERIRFDRMRIAVRDEYDAALAVWRKD